jgi:DNA-binding MarR family transcriptional regulator
MTRDSTRLSELDALLTRVRAAIQRPGYRRRILSGLDVPGGISTLRSLRAVEVLSRSRDPSIGDVATRMAVEHSTASRNVDAAAKAGLLSRRPCKEDLRRTLLELTPKGKALLKDTSSRRRALIGEVTEGWTAADIERLVELLDALCRGLDALETSP